MIRGLKTKMSIFFEIHKDLPREGPGDNVNTRRAFEMITGLPANPAILDIGCGPGMQTIELAQISDGKITAIDNHQPFLDTLNVSITKEGLSDRIQTMNKSMIDMDFEESSFDLIWSEGAIFIIGFEQGLQQWRRFLKPHGFMAITDCCWLKDNPPVEVKEFWDKYDPEMLDNEQKRSIIRKSGYSEVGHFILPESAWWQGYYNPVLKRIEILKQEYAGDSDAQDELDMTLEEVEMYRKYAEYYGYVFYIMQKTD
jgi:cyclopropane fatty-acyl-phospholipid synthase-like methyltransferase